MQILRYMSCVKQHMALGLQKNIREGVPRAVPRGSRAGAQMTPAIDPGWRSGLEETQGAGVGLAGHDLPLARVEILGCGLSEAGPDGEIVGGHDVHATVHDAGRSQAQRGYRRLEGALFFGFALAAMPLLDLPDLPIVLVTLGLIAPRVFGQNLAVGHKHGRWDVRPGT